MTRSFPASNLSNCSCPGASGSWCRSKIEERRKFTGSSLNNVRSVLEPATDRSAHSCIAKRISTVIRIVLSARGRELLDSEQYRARRQAGQLGKAVGIPLKLT